MMMMHTELVKAFSWMSTIL